MEEKEAMEAMEAKFRVKMKYKKKNVKGEEEEDPDAGIEFANSKIVWRESRPNKRQKYHRDYVKHLEKFAVRRKKLHSQTLNKHERLEETEKINNECYQAWLAQGGIYKDTVTHLGLGEADALLMVHNGLRTSLAKIRTPRTLTKQIKDQEMRNVKRVANQMIANPTENTTKKHMLKKVNNTSIDVSTTLFQNTAIHLPKRTIGGARDQIPRTKRCSCKRSFCLKLYCDCFNAGVLCCEACNCEGCKNIDKATSSDQESDLRKRMETIVAALERNPDAFRPKGTAFPLAVDGNTADGDKERKTGRNGCNCKRSFCLKKYCECFQNSSYCSESCTCVNCQNTLGNEKREKQVATLKRKEEENNATLAANPNSSLPDLMDLPTSIQVGGVPASTVSLIAAGLHAGGVDLIMPPSSYARPMIDDKGQPILEIAFGTSGIQNIGGIPPNEDDLQNQKKDDFSLVKELKFEHFQESLDKLKNGKSLDEKEKETGASFIVPSTKKRKCLEFANETTKNIVKDLQGIKAKMDEAMIQTKETLLASKKIKVESDDSIEVNGTEATDAMKAPTPTKPTLPEESIRDLYMIASSDIVLYDELARLIREKTKFLIAQKKSPVEDVVKKSIDKGDTTNIEDASQEGMEDVNKSDSNGEGEERKEDPQKKSPEEDVVNESIDKGDTTNKEDASQEGMEDVNKSDSNGEGEERKEDPQKKSPVEDVVNESIDKGDTTNKEDASQEGMEDVNKSNSNGEGEERKEDPQKKSPVEDVVKKSIDKRDTTNIEDASQEGMEDVNKSDSNGEGEERKEDPQKKSPVEDVVNESIDKGDTTNKEDASQEGMEDVNKSNSNGEGEERKEDPKETETEVPVAN